MITLAFPILTFDTTKLTPAWGYVFDPRWLDPYESVVSMLWKFVWMNRLAGHGVVEHVAKHNVDAYCGIAVSAQEIDARYLAHALRIRLQTVRESIPDPIPGRGLLSVLRYCKVSGQPRHLDHASRNMLQIGEGLSPEAASDAAATRRCGCSGGQAVA